MLRRDGYVKVLDFGLVKLTEQHGETPGQASTLISTEPGMVMGTANYMSPEQARGVEVDARTDVWSLGVVLYELVTGHTPSRARRLPMSLFPFWKGSPPSSRRDSL